MGDVKHVTKLTDNRFLNLYQLEAVRRDGTSMEYYMASRIRQPEGVKAVTLSLIHI